jgi:Ca-activated chloride channel family protein
MKLENPDLLHLLWALALMAVLLLVYWQWRKKTLKQLGSSALEERLMLGFSKNRFWFKNILFGLAVACIVISIANPQKTEVRQSEVGQSADIVIALDVSKSMLVKEGKKNRLEQAQDFIMAFTPKIKQDRVGLVFFAGEAFAQMPLSNDHASVMMFARNASPDFVTNQGTHIGSAIELATRLSEGVTEAGRAMILISDGENHEDDAIERAKKAHEEGWVIHTIGIGTAAGGTIPDGYGGMKRDYSGQIIRSSPNISILQAIATAGGGRTWNLSQGEQAVRELSAAIQQLPKATVEAKAYTAYITLYQWFLLPALLLLAFEQLLWWRMPAGKK